MNFLHKKMLLIIPSLLVFSASAKNHNGDLIHSEANSCDFNSTIKAYESKNPGALTKDLVDEKKLQAYILQKKILQNGAIQNRAIAKNSNKSYVIPVVFHVYGSDFIRENGTPTIVNQQYIKDALAIVNSNFVSSTHSPTVQQPFTDIEAGMNVKFKLAQLDPNGNTTTGIIYHEYQDGFALSSKNQVIKKYAWDNNKYFNIHIQVVLKQTRRTRSGTAWLPSISQSQKGIARVVYNGKYLLHRNESLDNSTFTKSSLTHEVGHWMNLHHTFKGGCVNDPKKGDKVADTPPTTQPKSGVQCDSIVTNCNSNPVNIENHMDYYAACEYMFTQGQVDRMDATLQTHSARKNLWKDSNLRKTGVKNNLGPRIVFNYQEFTDKEVDKFLVWIEDFHKNKNNGSILNKRKIKAINGESFAKSTGALIEGIDYTTRNVPSGLSVKIEILDSTTAQLSLVGRASSHEAKDSTTLEITLLDNAVKGTINNRYNTGKFVVKFIDKFGSRYGVLDKQYYLSKSSHNRGEFIMDYHSEEIGGEFVISPINFDGDQITFGSLKDKIEFLTPNKNSVNIKLLSKGVKISKNIRGYWHHKTELKTPGSTISSPKYTAWHGKTGYAAIRIPTILNSYIYGWIKLKVSADGNTANIISWGINTRPDNGVIVTGVNKKAALSFLQDRFVESNKNNGSISNSLVATLENETFIKTGILREGTHYRVTDLPRGLKIVVTAINRKRAKFSIIGKAKTHGWKPYTKAKLTFLDAAFSTKNASQVIGSSKVVLFEFIGDSFIKTAKNSNNVPILTSHQSIDRAKVSYGSQLYKTAQDSGNVAGLKFLSRRKDILSNEKYEMTPLNFRDEISPNSTWQPGREYWSYRGQHMIDSNDTGFKSWRGKTKYIGIRFRRSGKMHYGWIKASLDSNGKNFKFLEYGLSGKYDTGILAGTLEEITTPVIRDVAVLKSPSGLISDSTPTYSWNAVANAAKYYLRVYDSTGKKLGKWYSASQAGCPSGRGRCSITSKVKLSKGKGYWILKTRIRNTNKPGPWSIKKRFTIKENVSSRAIPIPLKPNVTSNNTPIFKWKVVAGFRRYAIVAYEEGNNKPVINNLTKKNIVCPNDICSYSKSGATFRNGKARWKVRTEALNGKNGAYSKEIFFTVGR